MLYDTDKGDSGMNKYEALKEYFGHDSFRSGQEELIDRVLAGEDVLGIMPTGAGKSMCYQIPALVSDGITIVVSPLISLMKDQVSALVQSGVRAAYLNSSLTARQRALVRRNILEGIYKIVYVSPERLTTEGFAELAARIDISLIAVDEAHCVSQWGQDFRPSYLKIREFTDSLPQRPPICALTATATAEVRSDIVKMLGLRTPHTVVTGFDRGNLYFGVRRPKDKFDELLDILKENPDACTIIYCSTRKNVEEVCMRLVSLGYPATRYHAGLEDDERRESQDDFLYDRCRIMVATNAFGMGIDKSNVTLVVHYNMPKNIESYYQEAGRAGRDGSESKCILLYGGRDVQTIRYFIDNPEENAELTEEMREFVKKRDLERLNAMVMYCTTGGCLREYILRYFGERPPARCGNCSNCEEDIQTEDVSEAAQMIVSCVYRIERRGRGCGKVLISEIMHGSDNQRIKSLGFDTLPTFGLLSNMTLNRIREIIDLLLSMGYLNINSERYNIVETTDTSMGLLKEKPALSIVDHKRKKQPARVNQPKDSDLFEQLKALRIKKAVEAGVPAYVIFTDASLRDMATKVPVTDEEFLEVSGVGAAKLKKYGEAFMNCIKDYLTGKK